MKNVYQSLIRFLECWPCRKVAYFFSHGGTHFVCFILAFLLGWHFYYRDYPSSIHGVLGDIKLEDAIDQEYINAIRSHLEEFLRQHPEVETIKTWEYLLFNDPPKEGDSTSYLWAPAFSFRIHGKPSVWWMRPRWTKFTSGMCHRVASRAYGCKKVPSGRPVFYSQPLWRGVEWGLV